MTIRPEVQLVTPEWAAKMLANWNKVNRKLRPKVVEMMVRDIKDGFFNGLNGETIKVGEDGFLKDGQHRLQAVVESNTPVQMVVVYDVPNDSQLTMDMGAKRAYYDILHIRGEVNASALAAIIKQVALREAGLSPSDGRALSYAQLDSTLAKYPELRDITREAMRLREQHKFVPVSATGLCLWLFGQIDEKDAAFFMARVFDGQNLSIGDPIYTLRKKLIALRESEGRAPSVRTVIAYMFIAWNAYRDGTKLHQFRFKVGGHKPDPLPEVH